MKNQYKAELKQAIEFHLKMDKQSGRIDKKAWPPWLLEIYEEGDYNVDNTNNEGEVL